MKNFSAENFANTLSPFSHITDLGLSTEVQNYLWRAPQERKFGKQVIFLGLLIQNSIPKYGKENKTFWKASKHVKIRVTVRPGFGRVLVPSLK